MAGRGRRNAISIEGVREMVRAFEQSKPELRKRAGVILEQEGAVALRDAAKKAPMATGKLRASAYRKSERDNPEFIREEIGFHAPYAAYVEESGVTGRTGKVRRRRYLAKAIRKRKKRTKQQLAEMLQKVLEEAVNGR